MIRELNEQDILFNNSLRTQDEFINDLTLGYVYLGYFLEDQLVSFINYIELVDVIEDHFVFTDPEHRNKGYALALFKYLINNSKKKIIIEVNTHNKAAISLYEKLGFKNLNIREKYYDDDDALVMVKEPDVIVMAIETSCDETSVSIIKNGNEELGTVVLSQMDIHKDYGGVVPEIASRNHTENITLVIAECLERANLKLNNITDIAVAYGPGLIGALLVGLQSAKTLSMVLNKPLIPVHHIAGHIYANNLMSPMQFPLIALVVSGGHTELILMTGHYQFKRLGSTLDDAVGEAYDKVARVMHLSYPGGPQIDRLAKLGKNTYPLPTPLDDETYNFSFSGLKSAVINLSNTMKMKKEPINIENLATSFQTRVVNILVKKTLKAMQDYQVNNLVIAGGVAANTALREAFAIACKDHNYNLTIPAFKYCTDNAAMIGAAAFYAKMAGKTSDLLLNSVSSEELTNM